MRFAENSILNLFDILLYFFVQAGVLYSMQIINIIRRLIMKKKLLAVLLCVAMVAAMAVGCGGGKDSGESKDEGKKSDLNIGVF